MTKELNLDHFEMTQLIHSTLSDTVQDLSLKVEEIRALSPNEVPDEKLMTLIDETRKFILFLKYSNEYMKKALVNTIAKEEILRIKLHLLSVLRALSDHVRQKDHYAIHDLITEELRDNLVMWKINVMPLLRPARAHQPFGSIHL